MRAVLLPLLLAACRPPQDVESIRRALAKTPIDVPALEEAFRVEPSALKIHAPRLPPLSLTAPAGPWILENSSSKPVWLPSSALRVRTDVVLFLSQAWSFGTRFGVRKKPGERPTFDPSAWILLPAGGRTALAFDRSAWGPGDLTLHAEIPDAGASIVRAAREFNKDAPVPVRGPLAAATVKTLLLPPAEWDGAPWHGTHAIEPRFLGAGRVELTLATENPGAPLELELFAVQGERVVRRSLKADSFDLDRGCALYAVDLSGEGRALFRAREVAGYVLGSPVIHPCNMSDDAASRWIPFRLD